MTASPAPVCALSILAWQLGSLPVNELWWRYAAIGGSADFVDLDLYLNGLSSWTEHEHNVLGHALNEQLWDTGQATLVPWRPEPS